MAEILDWDIEVHGCHRQGDPYRAFGPPAADAVSVSFIFRDGCIHGFPYKYLGCRRFQPATRDKGDVIILRFDGGIEIITITIEGQKLYPLWEQLMDQQTVWVRERPEDWRMDATAVVDSITSTSEPCVRPGRFRRF
jgi:hypothetical protein